MWIVRYALDRAYTIAVMAVLIVLAGVLSARKMSTDILPAVDIPMVNMIWTYAGLSSPEMAGKITSFAESATLNNVDDVLEVRSETTDGVAVVKIEFQPTVDISLALSQVTSVSQTILRRMPPGTSPPLVVRSSQSSQPIINLVLGSTTLDDAALYDYARLQLRGQIQNIPGIRMTLPYGGAARQVMIDFDPAALQRQGLTPADVTAALAAQNLTLPSGVLREGNRELKVVLNASPDRVAEFASLPLRTSGDRVITLSEVATVRDGPAVQTNIARLDGANAVMVSIIKLGNASTVDIVRQIKQRLPEIRASAPPGMTIEPVFDQSVFVQSAVDTLAFEAVLVGALVAAVVLLFIGSLRSTAIVLASIPLALLASVAGLSLAGQTFNLMTLGGLALAIGILVDNALVEIENTNRRVALGEPVRTAVLNSAREVVFPEFVSTLCICIVFLPIFLLTGVPAYVFKPMAMAVVFAMLASFVLSRTLVPMLAHLLLPGELARRKRRGLNLPERVNHAVEHQLDRLRDGYTARLGRAMARRGAALGAVGVAVVAGLAAGTITLTQLEREFFPRTDAGLVRVYLRAPTGLRLEDTARLFADVQRALREALPEGEIASAVEVIGAPDAINQGWVDSTVIGSFDGELFLQMRPGKRTPLVEVEATVRRVMAERFPQVAMLLRPADTTGLTLAGASPSTVDLRVVGRDAAGNRAAAQSLVKGLESMEGIEDVTVRQVRDQPVVSLQVDRVRALQLGVTQQQVSNAILAALGSGGSVAPQTWSDAGTGTSYPVQLIAAPIGLDNVETLLNMPVRTGVNGETILLRNVATALPGQGPANITRVTLAPGVNVLANAGTRDLGALATRIDELVATVSPSLKPGNRIELRGQIALMRSAYADLAAGLALAVLLVFLVQAANFQSWLLPLNAMAALPVALTGAASALWLTGTPLSVPAMMGMIMVIGVSTANSVLITSFARDRLEEGATPIEAALAAAASRLRPVLMTALAMIVGVLPMALGLGEGAEQNAPLGRAVVGGLLLGTFGTLLLVPMLFTLCARPRWKALQRRASVAHGAAEPTDVAANDGVRPAPIAGGSPLPHAATLAVTALVSGLLFGAPSDAVAQASAPATAPAPAKPATAPPEVRTARAKSVAAMEALRLPARTEPIEEARIYARTSGTLAERRADLGDRVAAGAVLARISAPEVDQAVASARASLEQARARERLAQLTLDRNRPLVEQNFVSSSRLDDLAAALDVARADSAAAAAELRRFEALQGFQTVRAPFAGTIVERSVERGDRVNADGANNAPSLFRLARLSVLRVIVEVPQSAAASLQQGQQARLTFSEFPGETFDARVDRLAGRIDATTGSMRVELNLPNPGMKLPAGLRGEVALNPAAGTLGVSVPVNAVQLVGGRPHVATVDPDNRLRFVPVQLGRTVGRDVEVRRGLAAGSVVVLNVNSMLQEGQTVKLAPPPQTPAL